MLFLALLVSSCKDDDFLTGGLNSDVKGSVISISDVVNGFYNFSDPASASVGFTVDATGEATNSVNLFKSFNGGESVQFATANSFTQSYTVPLSEAASGLVDMADLKVGDYFTFSFDDVNTSSGNYPSGTTLRVDVSCPSDLGGVYDFVSSNLAADNGYVCPTGEVTGTVTFTDLGGGAYECSDLGFGQYQSTCWNDGPATSPNATFSELCGVITSGGLDQYDLAYTWVITDVSGPNLSISWSNTYGDRGEVVITRPDGSDWPNLST